MRVLVLSKIFPSTVFPILGLWIERLTLSYGVEADVSVVSPVPYCPPLPSTFDNYTRYRNIAEVDHQDNYSVYRPRYAVLPGEALSGMEAKSYEIFVVGLVNELHHEQSFDIIHAHYGYPDGVVAARIGQRLGIPVVVTDHAFWSIWINNSASVRRQTLNASTRWAAHVCVSEAHRKDALVYTKRPVDSHVIHLGYNDALFYPGVEPKDYRRPRILYVGYINYTKGIDILLHAIHLLTSEAPELRVTLVGGGFDKRKLKQESELRAMARRLNLENVVQFAGIQPPEQVARHMRESTLLVSASRRETLGVVMIEAIASGLPVVATKSGGAEDIITPDLGVLVDVEDPEALADGIRDLLSRTDEFSPHYLHQTAKKRFSWANISKQYLDLFKRLIPARTYA